MQESLDRLGFVPDLYLIHNPYVAEPGHLKALWALFEALKDEGKLKSIGVSNFRPQDLEVILEGAKYKPVVNQVRFGFAPVLPPCAPLTHGVIFVLFYVAVGARRSSTIPTSSRTSRPSSNSNKSTAS